MYDWYGPLKYLLNKIDNYVNVYNKIDHKCTARAIIDLCQERDNNYCGYHARNDLNILMANVCTG